MTVGLKGVSVLAATVLVGVVLATSVAGQQQPPAQEGQRQGGGGRRGDATPPAPPAAQPGHPSGKLVIWGDLASFDNPPTVPTHCILSNRFKRGQRVGFRMTAIDGGTGETENTATMVVHINYMGQTIDVPTRWRGVGGFPAAEYPRQPSEMWTGVWVVPMDAQPGRLSYTVTATDRFGRTATFTPFINVVPQLTIVE
jgi:hypothetical protein